MTLLSTFRKKLSNQNTFNESVKTNKLEKWGQVGTAYKLVLYSTLKTFENKTNPNPCFAIE